MSDNALSQAVDLLAMCLGSQADSGTDGEAGSFTDLDYSEQLNVWAVVDARECGGECPVRYRVARKAGDEFGRILSGHLVLELGLLSIACRATGEDPHALLRQAMAEAGERWANPLDQQDLDDDEDEDDAEYAEYVEADDLGGPPESDREAATGRYPVDGAGQVHPDAGHEVDAGHVNPRHRMLLDHGDRTI